MSSFFVVNKAWRKSAMTRTYKEIINEMNRVYN
ncbi:hypothetical protein FXB61_005376 [Bacillus cereus]|uniref:Uncharacterized protein n=1 Tax=Bacillus thuringiensis TaxID=1428 RepID=A0A9X5N6P1_BACTU|nr:hypothetical protein FXB61_005376 [Bacillus cereus]OFC91406.1 hypothetical protein BTGOE4_39070 [Bacillus thuringiensis]